MSNASENEYEDIPEDCVVVDGLNGPNVIDKEGVVRTLEEFRALPLPQLAEVPLRATSWMDSDPAMLEASLTRRRTNRAALMDWLWGALVSGTDYGQVKQDQKPSLWQPGAEKICGYLDLIPRFPDADKYVEIAASGGQIGDVVMRCHLYDATGKLVGEGLGAREPGQNPKLNDRIKMAQKSALIDAVKRCAGLSEVFTQDGSEEYVGSPMDEEAREYLKSVAEKHFGEKSQLVLVSLAKRRFQVDSGDWHLIPAARLQDAVRSLEQKAAEGFEAEEEAT